MNLPHSTQCVCVLHCDFCLAFWFHVDLFGVQSLFLWLVINCCFEIEFKVFPIVTISACITWKVLDYFPLVLCKSSFGTRACFLYWLEMYDYIVFITIIFYYYYSVYVYDMKPQFQQPQVTKWHCEEWQIQTICFI